jgi:hypothetical protein
MDTKPVEKFGVRWTTTNELVRLNDAATAHSWGARFTDVSQLHATDAHVIVPMLKNAIGVDGIQSFRCYLWYRTQAGDRLCTLLDLAEESLTNLKRANVAQLESLALMLLDHIPIVAI